MTLSRKVPVIQWTVENSAPEIDEVVTEVPVALSYNKLSHVVMMLTPDALEDFAIGFSLTEGIIDHVSDVVGVNILQRSNGLEVAIQLNPDCFARLENHRRNLVGRTGCGLCGAESLDQAVRHPAAVESRVSVDAMALQKSVKSLNDHQPLQVTTGAVHGAAWCSLDGEVQVLREDVGRHNALDKLIGHLCRSGFDNSTGFILISSRASYEMVYKAAAVGIEILVAVSAPTSLAIDFAQRCGITLVGFARPGRHNVYTFEKRLKSL